METLAYGYGLAEAPVWVPPSHDLGGDTGAVVFTDVLGGGVHRWSPDGEVTTIVPKRRGVGGVALHADGGLVVTGRDLQHVSDSGTRTPLVLDGVTGFNDLTTDADGRVYVGALRFMPFAGEEPVPGEVWRVAKETPAARLFGDIDWPNGIGFSPDGRTVYTSDYAGARVLAHDLTATDDVENRRVFAVSPSGSADGLAVDGEGGVWVALGQGGGIARFSGRGSVEDVIDVPAGFVTSLCFGGADGRDLFITTADNREDPSRGGTLFRTRADVGGLPRALATI